MCDKETDEEFEARRSREFDEALDEARTFTPEEWEETKERMRRKDEEEAKRIFGDKKPTVWVDRYIDE
ncbi:hypothetical protein [Frankia sp. QA3]|uniref:hypothetical protein n=1 Tax=Frankia sp. QA3 TaxID=710111 RepID=UPI000269BB10|nr:hypothetical protein [Frankia sp. QA3]EIV91143.1 hypothetical protein FraQA3DRAFT_0575 [Frankia sp. QA3]